MYLLLTYCVPHILLLFDVPSIVLSLRPLLTAVNALSSKHGKITKPDTHIKCICKICKPWPFYR